MKADPSQMKHRQPANPSASNFIALQNTLLSGIEEKKHKVIEQLLNRSVSPNAKPNIALIEVTAATDLPTMQLLLEFGADPDLADDDRVRTL